MKRHWIEYTDKRKQGPMTYWVHVPCGADPTDVNPPYPVAIPDGGFPFYYVEVDGFTFQFASLDEMRVCIDTLGRKLLPNTKRLARDRGGDPNKHWLRKMPDETKPWRYREKAVKYLTKALREFEKELTWRPLP
jgi:hypothetical protein